MANRRKRFLQGASITSRRAVLYARYSDEQQRDSWSIDAQVAELRAYCARMGWTICDEICVDEAITGKTEDRPGLARAMTLIREGKANVLVVHKLDRFFRNVAKTFEYVAELEEYSAGLVCTQQPIDTTNPVSGKIVLAVMAALAEIYLDNLAEEVAKGKRARAAAGLPNGDLPYGYRAPEPTVQGASSHTAAVIVPAEAEAVRLAYELYATGRMGEASIARTLNDRGFRFRSKYQPEGGRFNKDTIRSMLVNPFYAGWVVQPDETIRNWQARAREAPRVRGLHQPIIREDLYRCVQATRAARRGHDERGTGRRGPTPERTVAPYLARGIARCRGCGRRLWGHGGTQRTPAYRCHTSNRGGVCICTRKALPASQVDWMLGEAIGAMRLTPAAKAAALTQVTEGAELQTSVEAQRAAILRKLERAKALLIDGDLSQQEYRSERARLEAELGALEPPASQVDVERAAALLDNLTRLWQDAGDEERRALAAQVVEGLYCDPNHPDEVIVHVKEAVAPVLAAMPECIQRVTDGFRTHNLWSHNPVLCRLSYGHHDSPARPEGLEPTT